MQVALFPAQSFARPTGRSSVEARRLVLCDSVGEDEQSVDVPSQLLHFRHNRMYTKTVSNADITSQACLILAVVLLAARSLAALLP